MIIKDASPAWSPDGKWIAFSSKRDGNENIWMMSTNGKKIKKITSKGGIYPKFSRDGKKIIYVSYRNKGSKGDVYIINLRNKRENRITKTNAIELYPSFTGSSNKIIYTTIDRDTNKDGKIDLNDNSVLMYKNISKGDEYPLTLYNQSSFNAKWLPLFRIKYNKGVILYLNQVGENININMIPENGVIPMKKNARSQYNLANKYLFEYINKEMYLLCLERTYQNFGRKRNKVSKIYVPKALVKAATKYKKDGDIYQVKRIIIILKKIIKK